MRTGFLCALVLLLAGPVAAQVQVDLHLEKDRYLAGEPVVVVADVRNIGDESVAYSSCPWDVSLVVLGTERRVLPGLYGCSSGIGSEFGCGVTGHPPTFGPGATASFRYLLKDYDLSQGEYQMRVSGKTGAYWRQPYVLPTFPAPPPPPLSRHTPTDPVEGDRFDRTLVLHIAPASEEELKRALAPMVADAEGNDPSRRYWARAAIIEGAPRFLAPLIARFAGENPADHSAIDALGRIATPESRMLLKDLFTRYRQASIILALARVGHPDDADFLANLLQDTNVDRPARHYAILGLGRIGGDQSVRLLDRALSKAVPENQGVIAVALGNTRSALAVPILISLYRNPTKDDACGALRTMTHRAFCDSAISDPVAQRRHWLRWWHDNDASAPIYGPDECPVDTSSADPAPADVRQGSPGVARPQATATPAASRIDEPLAQIAGIRPETPHPAQMVFIDTISPSSEAGEVELVDARGGRWRMQAGNAPSIPLSQILQLPDEIADGEATARLITARDGVDTFSAPFRFAITSDPLPLSPVATEYMSPVAAGQWAQLGHDLDTEFEITRADHVEVEFRQGDRAIIRQTVGLYTAYVQVPDMQPGPVAVRTRTWIEQKASPWSAPATFGIEQRPVVPITSIARDAAGENLWWDGPDAPTFFSAAPGDRFVISVRFPATRFAELHIYVRRPGETIELPMRIADERLQVEIPARIPSGDWRMVIEASDGVPAQEVTTVRVR